MSDLRPADEQRLDWALREVTGAEAPPDLTDAVLARRRRGDAALLPSVPGPEPRTSRWLAAAIVLLGAGVVFGVALWPRGEVAQAPVREPVQEPVQQQPQEPPPAQVYNKQDIEALPADTRAVEAHGLDNLALAALLRLRELRELEIRYDHALVLGLGLKTEPPKNPPRITASSFGVFALLSKLRALRLRGAYGITEAFPVIEGQDPRTRVDATLGQLEKLPLLEELALTHFDLPAWTFEALPRLRSLRRLDLTANYGVEPDTIGYLLKCTGLRSLKLSACMTLRAASIARLAELPNLEELDVGNIDGINWRSSPGDSLGAVGRSLENIAREYCKAPGRSATLGVTDEALRGLAHAPKLRVLDISQARCSLDGLAALRDLKSLEDLNLSGIASTGVAGGESVADRIADCLPPGLQRLAACGDYTDMFCKALREKLPRLEWLEFPACYRITDAGLAELVRIPSLRHLDIRQSRGLTEAAMTPLRAATQLEFLDLRHIDWVAGKHVAELRLALPRLQELLSNVSLADVERELRARRDQPRTVEQGQVAELPPDTRRVRGIGLQTADLRELQGCRDLEQLDLSTSNPVAFEEAVAIAAFSARALSSITDEDLGLLAACSKLRSLSLCGNWRLTGKTLGELARLPALESLDLAGCRLDPGTVARLAAFPALRSLRLDNAIGVEAEDLAALAARSGLRSLRLRGCWPLPDEAFQQLARLDQLEELDLGRGNFAIQQFGDQRTLARAAAFANGEAGLTTPALLALARLRKLRTLRLADGRFDPASLRVLASFPALEELELSGVDLAADVTDLLPRTLRRLDVARCTRLGDEFARRLAIRCPGLAHLDLGDTALGDDGLQALLGSSELTSLILAGTQVTRASRPALVAHGRFRLLDLRELRWVYEAPVTDLWQRCDDLRLGSRQGGALTPLPR